MSLRFRDHVPFGIAANAEHALRFFDRRTQMLLPSIGKLRRYSILYGLAYLLKLVRLKMMVRKCQRQHQLIVSSWHGLALSAAVESAPFDFPAFETHCVCHQHFPFGKNRLA